MGDPGAIRAGLRFESGNSGSVLDKVVGCSVVLVIEMKDHIDIELV
jgi:hypothetical protein